MKKGQLFNLKKLVVLFNYTESICFQQKLEICYYIILVNLHNILTFLKFINHTK